MTIEIRNLQWADHNTERSYPLTIEATKQDVTASFELPDDFIVALYLAAPSELNIDPGKFYISSIGNFTSGFGVTISYDAVGGPQKVATANIARSAFSEYSTFRLTGVDTFLNATGSIMLGKVDNIDQQPPGEFTFDLAGARLETDVVRPNIRALSSLRVQNGADLSRILTGHVVIKAGTNQRITVVQEAGEDPEIVFDAIQGEGLNEECVCEDDEDQAPCIRTLNGIPGTAGGDFSLLGFDCLKVQPITNGLQLVDTCSCPCCGCVELEIVTEKAQELAQLARTFEISLTNLESRVTQMDQVVLASRLGDQGCIDCN